MLQFPSDLLRIAVLQNMVAELKRNWHLCKQQDLVASENESVSRGKQQEPMAKAKCIWLCSQKRSLHCYKFLLCVVSE